VNGLELVPAVEQYCAQLLWSKWLISTISSWAAPRGDLICIRSPGGPRAAAAWPGSESVAPAAEHRR
jgi:hypothetical protein